MANQFFSKSPAPLQSQPAPVTKKTKPRTSQKYSLLSQMGLSGSSEVPKVTDFFEPRKNDGENRFDVALIRPYNPDQGVLSTNRVYLSYGITTFGRSPLFGLVDPEIAEEQAELKVAETDSYVDIQLKFLAGMPMGLKLLNSSEFIILEKNKIYTLTHGDAIFVGHQVFTVEVVKSQKTTIQETFHFKQFQDQIAQQPQWPNLIRRRGPKNQPDKAAKKKADTVPTEPKKRTKRVASELSPAVPTLVQVSVVPPSMETQPDSSSDYASSPSLSPASSSVAASPSLSSASSDIDLDQLLWNDITAPPTIDFGMDSWAFPESDPQIPLPSPNLWEEQTQ